MHYITPGCHLRHGPNGDKPIKGRDCSHTPLPPKFFELAGDGKKKKKSMKIPQAVNNDNTSYSTVLSYTALA